MTPPRPHPKIPRIEVLHGVNLNMLGSRDPRHYGTLTLADVEQRIAAWAGELDMRVTFFQTNAESAYVERLHAARERLDGLILNPGSWTHYAWSIHDALELTGLPAVEVHISDVTSREPWRRLSVIGDLCIATVSGEGVEGYRHALERLRAGLDEPNSGREGSGSGREEPGSGREERDR